MAKNNQTFVVTKNGNFRICVGSREKAIAKLAECAGIDTSATPVEAVDHKDGSIMLKGVKYFRATPVEIES